MVSDKRDTLNNRGFLYGILLILRIFTYKLTLKKVVKFLVDLILLGLILVVFGFTWAQATILFLLFRFMNYRDDIAADTANENFQSMHKRVKKLEK